MERNKRNSIAGFPTWTDNINEDRDATGGFGVGEMGLNSPSQVSLCILLRIMHHVHKNTQDTLHYYLWESSASQK